MNHLILVGFLGKDPEERISKNGKKGIFFSLAVDYFSAKEKRTEWFQIIIWDDMLFPMALSLHKGSLVSVCGTLLPSNPYLGKDGSPKITQTLKASALYFLPGSKKPVEEDKDQILEETFL